MESTRRKRTREEIEIFEESFTNHAWMRLYGGPLMRFNQPPPPVIPGIDPTSNPEITLKTAKEETLKFFEQSPFFDQESNNVLVWKQQKSIDALVSLKGTEFVMMDPSTIPPKTQEAENVCHTLGQSIDYDLHIPPLIIARQRRKNPTAVVKEGLYYLMDGALYQSPHLHRICNYRLQKSMEHLKRAFDMLNDAVKFSSTGDYYIGLDKEEAENDEEKKDTQANETSEMQVDARSSSASVAKDTKAEKKKKKKKHYHSEAFKYEKRISEEIVDNILKRIYEAPVRTDKRS